MKRMMIPVLACLALTQSYPASADQPQEIVVDIVDDADLQDLQEVRDLLGGASQLRLNSIHSESQQLYIVDASSVQDIRGLLMTLRRLPLVEEAEVSQVYHISGVGVPLEDPPNDPKWDKQWNMHMIGVTSAWRSATGQNVIVAVIDTGVAYRDLDDFVQVEDLRETKFVTGYDFVNDDALPLDDHGHGTHVAGTIAQSTNNGIGVAGVAPHATIMPLKVLSAYGGGSTADIVDAIRFATDNGANVINMSLGGAGFSKIMADAVKYARDKGVFVACAAGNSARGTVEYPAAYPGAFAVSSVGPSRKLAFYSSWGKEIAVAAPGGDKNAGGDASGVLQNTVIPGKLNDPQQYLAFQGTSMSAPHVAGLAALVYSRGVTNVAEVEDIIRNSAVFAAEQEEVDTKYGHGIISASAALTQTTPVLSGWLYLVLALCLFAGLAYKNEEAKEWINFGWLSLVALFTGSAGAFFVQGTPVEGIPVLGTLLANPVPAWDMMFVGTSFYRVAMWTSVLPYFMLVICLLHKSWLRGPLIAFGIGWAVNLGLNAFFMPTNISFVPGAAGTLDCLWLATNAALTLGLALRLRKQPKKEAFSLTL